MTEGPLKYTLNIKLLAVDENYIAFIKDQMSEIPNVETKRMFGGLGFFREGTMFAMIGGGRKY